MKPTYVLHPGKIRGHRGMEHYTAEDLAELYGIDLMQCLDYSPLRRYTDTKDIRYIHLRPRADGKYQLPYETFEDDE